MNKYVCVFFTRVANVVADHDSLLTQWRPIKMSKFCANIFLIRTTSNYFWASEVSKNQVFKSQFFSSSQYKNYPKLKTWVNSAPKLADKKCQFLTFKVNFLCQKLPNLSIFFSLKNINLGAHFLLLTFFDSINF